jgi:hypothetical protein
VALASIVISLFTISLAAARFAESGAEAGIEASNDATSSLFTSVFASPFPHRKITKNRHWRRRRYAERRMSLGGLPGTQGLKLWCLFEELYAERIPSAVFKDADRVFNRECANKRR